MKYRNLFLVICLIGLSLFTVKSSLKAQSAGAQGRVYANFLADSSADFAAARLAVDASVHNFAYINTTLGVLTSSFLSFKFPSSGKAGDAITVLVQSGGLLNTSVLSCIQLRLYNSSGANVANASGSSTLQLSLLSSGDSVCAIRYVTDPNANFEFDQVVVQLNNVLSVNLLHEFRIYGVFYQPSCPPVMADAVYTHGSSVSPSLLSGYVTNSNNAVNPDNSLFASLIAPLNLLGLLPSAFLDLSFPVNGNGGEYAGFTISQSSTLLNLNLLGNLSITAYNSSNTIVASKSGFSLLDLKLLSGTTDQYTLGFVTPEGNYTFSRLRINLTSTVGLLLNINVHNAFHYKIDAAPVNILAGGDLSFCHDSTVVLTADIATTDNSFLWSTGETTPSITVNSTGTYAVSVTNTAGCTFSSVPVSLNQLPTAPASLELSHVKCNGGNNGSVQIVLPGGTSDYTCLWNTGGTDFSVASLLPGNYFVDITETATGCVTNFPVMITEPAPLQLAATSSEETCHGKDARIQLIPSGGAFPYTYSTSGMIQGNEVIGLNAGNYTIEVTDANSCKNTTTVQITKVDCSTPITIHDVITPNDDGYNDVLFIDGIERYPFSDLMVFNKWGDMVYENNNYNNTWTGNSTSKNDVLPAGTYFYLLKLNGKELPNGKSDYTGHILIQR